MPGHSLKIDEAKNRFYFYYNIDTTIEELNSMIDELTLNIKEGKIKPGCTWTTISTTSAESRLKIDTVEARRLWELINKMSDAVGFCVVTTEQSRITAYKNGDAVREVFKTEVEADNFLSTISQK